ACVGRALVSLVAAEDDHRRVASQLEGKKDIIATRDAVIVQLKEESTKMEADLKGQIAEKAAELEKAKVETSALSEEKKTFEAEVADLRARLAVVEQHFKISEAKLVETERALSEEKANHEAARKECVETRELVGRQHDAHQADIAKLEKEKSDYGEFMYENGFQAGKDSVIVEPKSGENAEVEVNEAGEEDEAGGPDLEIEMNTCLNLRWIIERYDAGYYNIDDLRLFLFHKLEKYGFDSEIKGMHVAADEDEREFC
ncbi:Unknown protein, partial [Striga hermonthica]